MIPFQRSAHLYDAIYRARGKDYRAEAARILELVREHHPRARSLLDVACGTGLHLAHLRLALDRVEGLDLNPTFLEVARERNPGVELHEADMRDFDLGRTFDVLTCLFSSIGFVTTLEDLQRTLRTLARHLAPEGLLVLEPWFSGEDIEHPHLSADVVDEADLKAVRMSTGIAVRGRRGLLEFHYLVGRPEGIEHFTERMETGLFTDGEYRAALEGAGLLVHHDPVGLTGRGLYLARRGPGRVPRSTGGTE